jgi:hypothetical protein
MEKALNLYLKNCVNDFEDQFKNAGLLDISLDLDKAEKAVQNSLQYAYDHNITPSWK